MSACVPALTADQKRAFPWLLKLWPQPVPTVHVDRPTEDGVARPVELYPATKRKLQTATPRRIRLTAPRPAGLMRTAPRWQ